MKTGKWGKTILALLLAVMMILPSVAAMAEEATEEEPSYEGTPIKVEEGIVSVYDFDIGDWIPNEELTESMKLGGDLAVAVENVNQYDYPDAVTVDAQGTEESFEVTGSVSMDIVTKDEDDYADADVTAAEVYAEDGSSADLTVGGDITASVESAGDYTWSYSYGLYTSADDGSTVQVTAGGDVSATTVVIDESEEGEEAEKAIANAVSVSGMGDTTIGIDGSATAEAVAPEGQAYAGAIVVNSNGGDGDEEDGDQNADEPASSLIEITVNQNATAIAVVGDKNDDDDDDERGAIANTIFVTAQEGQTVNVTVDGHAAADAANEGDGKALAVGVEAVTEGEGADITITVLNGVEATATAADEENKNAAAIATENNDGTIIVNVTGDVVSSDLGIVMEDQDGGDDREGGESFVTVVGNVTAEDTAVMVDLTEAKSTMEITVTETVEGKEHAIVLSEETIAENLTLTVWEVKPNDAGNIVERAKLVEDEEGGESIQYTADKDTEKLIQYIIKIEDNSKDYITATGTNDFTASNGEKYQVANEGDKILVKLNIPEGKELVGAYWNVDQTEEGKLLVDSEGNYYLEVPRGGGVELSLVMKDLPGPDSETETKTQTLVQTKQAALKDAKDTEATGKIKDDLEKNGLNALPKDILDKLPSWATKLLAMKTLILVDYDDTMGTMTFALECGGKFKENQQTAVVLIVPDENGKNEWFVMNGVGQADGTLKVTIDVNVLKELLGKTFVAAVFGE